MKMHRQRSGNIQQKKKKMTTVKVGELLRHWEWRLKGNFTSSIQEMHSRGHVTLIFFKISLYLLYSFLIYSFTVSILLLIPTIMSFVSTPVFFKFDISTWLFLHHVTTILPDCISDKPMNQLVLMVPSSKINSWQTTNLLEGKKHG